VFSRRLSWQSQANEISRRLAAKAGPIRDLTLSNPTRAGLVYPSAEILGALAHPHALRYEPSPLGLPVAREAIAQHLVARAPSLRADDIVCTASTSEAYAYLFKLLCDPGDAVLVPQPSYPLFEYLAALEGVRLAPYPLAYDGTWHVDLPAVSRALAETPRTRAILLVNPNNPTGSYVSRPELAALTSLAKDHELALVSDEVFAEYPASDVPDPHRVTHVATPELDVLAFSLGGLSKSLGLPQLKLGWIAIGGPQALCDEARQRLELIADTYLSVATPVQLAAPTLLAVGETVRLAILARVRENRAWLEARIPRESPVSVLRAEGGWYATLRLPATRSDEDLVLELLDEHDTLVHPGYFFDLAPDKTHLVVSLLCETATFQGGIEAVLRTQE
jgi:aspartate/methionine/tyrosine aminotransferase